VEKTGHSGVLAGGVISSGLGVARGFVMGVFGRELMVGVEGDASTAVLTGAGVCAGDSIFS